MSSIAAGLEVIRDKKILILKFNNPKRNNALTIHIYANIAKELQAANKDDSITTIVLTGAGNYYTSGNDLTQAFNAQNLENPEFFKQSNQNLHNMLTAFLECNKLLIALVNGPCLGIGATMSSLCDIVWCVETAYFLTPFTKLGISPEGCSSYVFPLILGRSKANEMLLLSERLSAQEALQFHLVSRIYKANEIDTVIWPKIHEYSNLPSDSMQQSKQLIRSMFKPYEYKALTAELRVLRERLQSSEFLDSIIAFMNRKNKSKL